MVYFKTDRQGLLLHLTSFPCFAETMCAIIIYLLTWHTYLAYLDSRNIARFFEEVFAEMGVVDALIYIYTYIVFVCVKNV